VITLLANKNCHDPTPKHALDDIEARNIKGISLGRPGSVPQIRKNIETIF
jgi:hypothetical protein